VPEITDLFIRLNAEFPWISKEVYTVEDSVKVLANLLDGGDA
jgi:hypothetical protein